MVMSEKTKVALAKIAQFKSERRLKNIDPMNLLIACDYADDRGRDTEYLHHGLKHMWPFSQFDENSWAYLKYATPQQIEALKGRLEWHFRYMRFGRKTIFRASTLYQAIKFVGVIDPGKYICLVR